MTNSATKGAIGVYGIHNTDKGDGSGVLGITNSTTNYTKGVAGIHNSTSGKGVGLFGKSNSPDGFALLTDGMSGFNGDIFPGQNQQLNCGLPNRKWKNVFCVNLIQTSLSEFKENIESPSDIDYLSSIPEPIYFNWRETEDKRRHLGFMGDHLPDIAKEDGGGVHTGSVIALLCGAVKKMEKLIDKLHVENSELQKRIENLEKN
jgi:hypothetical protein